MLTFLNNLFPWSLIDDAQTIINSREIEETILRLDLPSLILKLLDSGSGRIRPFYWIINLVKLRAFGLNSFVYHLFQVALLIFVCLLLYKIAYKIYSKKRIALLSPALFILFSPSVENWYRLGPVEPLQVLLLALTLFFLVNKSRVFLTSVFLTLSFLMKESSSMLFLVFVAHAMLFRKGYRKLQKRPAAYLKKSAILASECGEDELKQVNRLPQRTPLLEKVVESHYSRWPLLISGILAFSIPLLLVMFNYKSGYGGSYRFDVNTITTNLVVFTKMIFSSYGLLGFLLTLGSLSWVKNNRNGHKEEISWFFFFLSGSFFFIAFQLPWGFPLGRYLLPSVFFLSLSLPVGITYFQDRNKLKFLMAISLLLFAFNNLMASYETVSHLWTRDFSNSKLIEFLGVSSEKNANILLNIDEGGIEWVKELGQHLDIFRNRNDLKSDFLSLSPNNAKQGDYILFWSEGEKYDKASVLNFYGEKIDPIRRISFFRLIYAHNTQGAIKRFITGKIVGNSGDYLFFPKEYRWEIYKVL